MSEGSRRLDSLPVEIMRHIATYTNRPTAERLMSTNKGCRKMGEMALEPFLKEQRMTVNPPFVDDIYKPIDTKFSQNDRERGKELAERSSAYASYLSIYPPAAATIRHLTLELRDDDTKSGWTHLKRLGPQLESLNVHMFDNLWRLAEEYDYDDDAHSIIAESCSDPADTWEKGLGSTSPFLNLTSLTISATSRVLDHFIGILPFAPNLREVVLNCHWSQYGSASASETPSSRSLQQLQKLTLTGNFHVIAGAASAMMPVAQALQHVVLYAGDPDAPIDWLVLDNIPTALASRNLRSLALFGYLTEDILRSMESRQIKEPEAERSFQTITNFVLDGWRGKNYPITYSITDMGPTSLALPNLESFVRVQRRQEPSVPTFSFGELSSPLLVDPFDRFPKLRQLQIIQGYPSNPFAKHIPSRGPGAQARCYILRSYGSETGRLHLVKVFNLDTVGHIEQVDIGVYKGEDLTTVDVSTLFEMLPTHRDEMESARDLELPREWAEYLEARY